MNPQEFSAEVEKKANELKNYMTSTFPARAGRIAMRFVNGNFRAGGFQGTSFKKWKPNKKGTTTLVKTGKLRAATYFTTQPGQFTIKNPMPYAILHNEGFKGQASVKAHSRNKYGKAKVGTGKFTKSGKERTRIMTVKVGEKGVKGHSRQINIPQRQFIPTVASPSPILNNAILREVARDIDQIMK